MSEPWDTNDGLVARLNSAAARSPDLMTHEARKLFAGAAAEIRAQNERQDCLADEIENLRIELAKASGNA